MPTISPRLALARDLTRCAVLEVDGARVAMEQLAARVYAMSDAAFEDAFLDVITAREAVFTKRGGPRERFYPDRRAIDARTFRLVGAPAAEPDEPDDPAPVFSPLGPSRTVRWLSIAGLTVVLLVTALVLSALGHRS